MVAARVPAQRQGRDSGSARTAGREGEDHWFVARCIKQLRKDAEVRAIISYADSNHHTGTIYRACNFKYYGLTDARKDFYFADGTKHSRGSVKGKEGEWKDRSRKHRYVMIFDKNLKCLWEEQKYGIM